jgi:hypothetical protein
MWGAGSGSRFRVRSWLGEFLDFSAFNLPSKAEYNDRLAVNLAYYDANYFVVMLLCSLYMVYRYPWSLLILITLVSTAVYLFLVRTVPLNVAGRVVSRRETAFAFSGLSFLLLFYFGSWSFLAALSLGLLLCLLHASFRIRNLKTSARFDLFAPRFASDMKKEVSHKPASTERPACSSKRTSRSFVIPICLSVPALQPRVCMVCSLPSTAASQGISCGLAATIMAPARGCGNR